MQIVGLLVMVLALSPTASAGVTTESYSAGFGTAVVDLNGDITVSAEIVSPGVGGALFTDSAGFEEAVIAVADGMFMEVPLVVCTGHRTAYSAVAASGADIAADGCYMSCNVMVLNFGAAKTDLTVFVLVELTDMIGGLTCHSSMGAITVHTE